MKHEWRKHEKELYMPKEKAELVTVPKLKFLMINGVGNPNDTDFKERIERLYTLSYAIRMMPKKDFTPEGYFEYTVYLLEGIWDLTETGRQKKELDKNELVYTLMIRQPVFVTQEIVDHAFTLASQKKNVHPFLNQVYFGEQEDGLCLQILHLGSYDSEPESLKKLDKFANENQLERMEMTHREIYLSDARKVAPDKLKTVLRYKVKKRD